MVFASDGIRQCILKVSLLLFGYITGHDQVRDVQLNPIVWDPNELYQVLNTYVLSAPSDNDLELLLTVLDLLDLTQTGKEVLEGGIRELEVNFDLGVADLVADVVKVKDTLTLGKLLEVEIVELLQPLLEWKPSESTDEADIGEVPHWCLSRPRFDEKNEKLGNRMQDSENNGGAYLSEVNTQFVFWFSLQPPVDPVLQDDLRYALESELAHRSAPSKSHNVHMVHGEKEFKHLIDMVVEVLIMYLPVNH